MQGPNGLGFKARRPESLAQTEKSKKTGTRHLGLWVALILFGLVVLVIADSVVGSRTFVPQGHIIAAQLTEAIGRPVEIRGGVRLRLFPQLRFQIMDLRIGNLPGRDSPDLARIEQVDLEISLARLIRLDLEIASLTFRNVHLEIETDEDGHFELDADPQSVMHDDPFVEVDMHLDKIRVENLTAFYRRGKTGEVTSFTLEEFEITAATEESRLEVRAEGSFRGSAFLIEGEIGTGAEVFKSDEPFEVLLKGTVLGAKWSVDGMMASSLEDPKLDLLFDLEVPDLEAFIGHRDSRLVAIGAIEIEGSLESTGRVLGVSDLVIYGESKVLHGEISGSIGDLVNMSEVDLAVQLSSDDVGRLDSLVARRLPKIDHFNITADISDADGLLGIHGSARATRTLGNIEVDVRGRCKDLRELRDIELKVEIVADDLATLGDAAHLDTALPDFGPVHANINIDDADGSLGAKGELSVGQKDGSWADIEAEVDDLDEIQGVKARLHFGATNLDAFRRYIGETDLDFGPITGFVDLSDADGSLGIENLQISVGQGDRFQVRASGVIDDLLELDEIELDLSFRGQDLQQIGKLFGADLPPISPVEFSGKFSGSDEELKSDGSALLGQSRFSGKWSVSLGKNRRPSLRGVITSDHVRLRDIGIEPAVERPALVDKAREIASSWWVGNDKLPFDELRSVDFVIDLSAGKVTGRSGFEATDVKIRGDLQHGKLRLGPVSARSVGAAISSVVVIDASLARPEISIDFKANGVNLGALLSQWREDVDYDGIVTVDLNLKGVGGTANELRRSLKGDAFFAVWGATFASDYGKRFLLDLGRVAMPDFNVKKAQTAHCLGGAFKIESGVATTEMLLLESREVTVLGSGKIDLGRQEYDLRLVPRPRNPGLLSTAATVDVTGSLDSPKFSPVATSLATTAAKAFYSNFRRLGGMFLSPVLKKREGDRDMCEMVLGPRPSNGSRPEVTTSGLSDG